MREVARIQSIWRYPVKSMEGEALDAGEIGELGLAGDRGYALRDEAKREIRGGKKFPALMRCRARYREEPGHETLTPVDIELPDAAGSYSKTASDAVDVNEVMSRHLGKAVTLWPRRPADDLDHYRRGERDHPDAMTELRSVFGRVEGEPIPDLGPFAHVMEYSSPLGTYFDAFPIHFLTTSWLDHLAEHNPDSNFDVRRFRPNFVLETEASGLAELAWVGKTLRFGEVEMRAEVPCPRCSMTTHATYELPVDRKLLRTIVQKADQNVGLYASVTRPGRVRVGDAVCVLD